MWSLFKQFSISFLVCCLSCVFAQPESLSETNTSVWAEMRIKEIVAEYNWLNTLGLENLNISEVFLVKDIALLHDDFLNQIPEWLESPKIVEASSNRKITPNDVLQEVLAVHASYYLTSILHPEKGCMNTIKFREKGHEIINHCIPMISESEAMSILETDEKPLLVEGSNGFYLFPNTRFNEIYLFGIHAVNAINGEIYEMTDEEGNIINPFTSDLRPVLATGWDKHKNPPFYLDIPYRVRPIDK